MRLTRIATIVLAVIVGLPLAGCAAQRAQSGAAAPAPPPTATAPAELTPAPSPTATASAESAPAIPPTATVPAELVQYPHADWLREWDEAPPLPQSVKAKAAALLAERLGVDVKEIVYVEHKALEWNDASIGCARPGYAYAQVMTPGYTLAFRDQARALHFVNANHDGSRLDYCP